MQAEFRAPRRRVRVQEDYEAPLPVRHRPGQTSEFRGQLLNQHVLVCDQDHIRRIHSQGYFGKGILSRSRPEYSIFDRWERHRDLFLPVVTQSRYDRLLEWAGTVLSAQGLEEQVVSQTLVRLRQPVEVEDVRREVGGNVEAEPDAKRSCSRLDLNPDPSSDHDSDSDSDSDPDPGPAFVLVVSDNQAVSGVGEIRRSPVSFTEYLQLSLEEAFFLVYSLGCLTIYLHQEPLSIIQLWRRFRALRPDFISSFAAYQHCRSRGWVPKGGSGAKYGADFMLYRKGPPFYHASYSVVVERVDDKFRDAGLRPFSWRSLAALSRITANVSKELMLCYVIVPADLSEAELDSPECLSRLKVQEVIVSRWVSSRERAEQDDI